jgi:hypothetical protein
VASESRGGERDMLGGGCPHKCFHTPKTERPAICIPSTPIVSG